MRGKVGLAVGLGVGWVLGTRYGRKGYDELKQRAKDVVTSPRVQRGVRDAEKFIGQNVPGVGPTVADAIGKAREAVTDAATDTSGTAPADDRP